MDRRAGGNGDHGQTTLLDYCLVSTGACAKQIVYTTQRRKSENPINLFVLIKAGECVKFKIKQKN